MGRPRTIRSVYLDASCLIGICQGDQKHKPLLSVLARLDSGEIELIASTALIAEFLPNHPRSDGAAAAHVADLLEDPRTRLVDVSPSVSRRAREYRESMNLSTWDAIHLATAVEQGADVLFAVDGRLTPDTDVDGVWISHPFDLEEPNLFNQQD